MTKQAQHTEPNSEATLQHALIAKHITQVDSGPHLEHNLRADDTALCAHSKTRWPAEPDDALSLGQGGSVMKGLVHAASCLIGRQAARVSEDRRVQPRRTRHGPTQDKTRHTIML